MPTISEAVKEDHRELEEYYDKIVNATDDDTKTRYQNLFTWELARHSIGEELILYPAMEEKLGEKGKALADRDREEHQKTKQQLKVLQDKDASDHTFLILLKTLMKDLSHHVEEEERDDLPDLENELQGDESQRLAKSFERTKLFVPSRSHPSLPNKPPFETVAGLLAAPTDKLGDMFRKFPQE